MRCKQQVHGHRRRHDAAGQARERAVERQARDGMHRLNHASTSWISGTGLATDMRARSQSLFAAINESFSSRPSLPRVKQGVFRASLRRVGLPVERTPPRACCAGACLRHGHLFSTSMPSLRYSLRLPHWSRQSRAPAWGHLEAPYCCPLISASWCRALFFLLFSPLA